MISYFQDSHILRQGNRYFNAKDSHFFDRFTSNLKRDEKLHIFMRQKRLDDSYDISKLMEVSTDNIQFHEMPSFWNIRNWPRIVKIIKKVIENSEFSFLRTEGIYGSIAACFCLKKHVKYMSILPADPQVGLREHGLIGFLVSIPHTFIVKKAVKNADYAYYVTESYLQEKYPSNGVCLGCSDVKLEPVSDNLLNNRIKKIKSKNRKFVIGTAGALQINIKGQDLVFELLRKFDDSRFVYRLVGSGDSKEMKELANGYGVESKVSVEGTIPHDDVFKWLDDLDLYIQPSRTEGLPRALIEAMSRGLPCIGSSVGGIPELLPGDCIFKKGDVSSLENVFLSFINPEKMERCARENFEKAKSYNKIIIEKKNKEFFDSFNSYVRSK